MRKTIFPVIFALLFAFCATTGFAQDSGKLNLNEASLEDLVKVPGLDKDMAQQIIDYREESGEFVDVQELLDLEGFDARKLRKIRPHVEVAAVAGCNC